MSVVCVLWESAHTASQAVIQASNTVGQGRQQNALLPSKLQALAAYICKPPFRRCACWLSGSLAALLAACNRKTQNCQLVVEVGFQHEYHTRLIATAACCMHDEQKPRLHLGYHPLFGGLAHGCHGPAKGGHNCPDIFSDSSSCTPCGDIRADGALPYALNKRHLGSGVRVFDLVPLLTEAGLQLRML